MQIVTSEWVWDMRNKPIFRLVAGLLTDVDMFGPLPSLIRQQKHKTKITGTTYSSSKYMFKKKTGPSRGGNENYISYRILWGHISLDFSA